MLCEQCKAKEATVHIIRTVNGHKEEKYLCRDCAEKSGELKLHVVFKPNPISPLLKGFFESEQKVEDPVLVRSCPVCGLTLDEFKRGGKLGCAGCYKAFEETLTPLLSSMHGSSRHMGKTPTHSAAEKEAANERAKLSAALKEAILREEYEEAARLRDAIRALDAERKGEEA